MVPIIVHPPSATGGRRVRVDGQILGLAHNVNDVLDLLRGAGLDPAEIDLDGPLIDWRGGGSYDWEPRPDEEG